MEYTKEETALIGCAVSEAETTLGSGIHLFYSFIERYLDNQDGINKLISDLRLRPNGIQLQIHGIAYLLSEARRELRTFTEGGDEQ
jgi:hypothetical protein